MEFPLTLLDSAHDRADLMTSIPFCLSVGGLNRVAIVATLAGKPCYPLFHSGFKRAYSIRQGNEGQLL